MCLRWNSRQVWPKQLSDMTRGLTEEVTGRSAVSSGSIAAKAMWASFLMSNVRKIAGRRMLVTDDGNWGIEVVVFSWRRVRVRRCRASCHKAKAERKGNTGSS